MTAIGNNYEGFSSQKCNGQLILKVAQNVNRIDCKIFDSIGFSKGTRLSTSETLKMMIAKKTPKKVIDNVFKSPAIN